ncbi:peptidase S8 [bacterium (Candidatus Blackallbacteria) CG17_big_fil_post_rev_8_21_14_2_50_48_46]|uniref:Peptidase S8 n=1 Tax=bacterium (Candidatus Blackallbacteria) CG17_big_fil_post_rev_8_21_14_2_50_48_46 TaxID=2014261 RepID=A0A2M7G7H7_9BACT|nr:MAG: alkaline serine protease [bacterium (Candidatus Blackallbacteria) CG18_big_fil_WC_8_21_14_2_50_49_26]PIW17922.1 MAG: peptidase S8 [bacterium (Candidatus Blackallbacteria) CG17_big_fil_post_rev_8_21_14_2_50_48_46]PIW45741.1 MAG: peptidase S8 [bacterium (Candidatus Blackallbacteria) CG13_big_fil_rev_8_21_14_2_50_49_14]
MTKTFRAVHLFCAATLLLMTGCQGFHTAQTPSQIATPQNKTVGSAMVNPDSETDLQMSSLMPSDFGIKDQVPLEAGAKIPGRFIVKFKADVSEAEAEEIRDEVNAVHLGYIQRSQNLEVLESENLSESDQTYAELKNNPNIELVEQDALVAITQIPAPTASYPINDFLFKYQYGQIKTQAQQGWALAKDGKGLGENTIIAVADTGVDGSHPDLKDKIVQGYSAFASLPYNGDTHGHGSHCAGIAAASTNNNIGIAGYAPNAKIMPIRILDNSGYGTLAGVSAGITYAADHGATVLSMSFAGPVYSQVIENAINYALSKNTIAVAGMANTGSNAVMYPAAYAGVIAVGATDSSDKRTSFSTYGNHIHVMAPGVNIMSTIPGTNYIQWNGTSMATPAVSGLVALIKSVLQDLTPVQVKYLIKLGADDMEAPGFDIYTGYGRMNVYKTLYYAFLKLSLMK